MSIPVQNVLKVKRKHEQQWLDIQGVVAVGVGTGESRPAIIVSVERDSEEIRRLIPPLVEDIPVSIKVTGELHARPRD